MKAKTLIGAVAFLGMFSLIAGAQPTISGVNAFWWLGPGNLSDCVPGAACYYAQATWTANANGASGTPTWNVSTAAGGGNVSLSCTLCTTTVATSTAPSNGCVYDVTVYLTYPDASRSPNFNVAIITPKSLSLQYPYPSDVSWSGSYGYTTTYEWELLDSCGNPDSNIHGNETFGTWYDVYSGNTWGYPSASSTYGDDPYWYDTLAARYQAVPPSENPQSPLSTELVKYNYPWQLWMGSATFGSGVSVQADYQIFWVDHGRHSPTSPI